jgi:hypothetical protein
MDRGARHLREFLNAPEAVQRSFMDRIALEAREDASRHVAILCDHGISAPPGPCRTQWGEKWRRRAATARKIENGTLGMIDADELKAIPMGEWSIRLTGEEPNREGKVICPAHDDSHPSCRLYPGDRGWYCFACGAGGSVIDFAAALWGLDPERDFRAICERLREVCGA